MVVHAAKRDITVERHSFWTRQSMILQTVAADFDVLRGFN